MPEAATDTTNKMRGGETRANTSKIQYELNLLIVEFYGENCVTRSLVVLLEK